MPVTTEALLGELAEEVRTNTKAYIKVESSLSNIQEDNVEIKAMLSTVVATQNAHAERLTVVETKADNIEPLRQENSDLKAQLAALRAQQEATLPQKTPWTAIVASVVAIAALAWNMFGG